MPPASMFLNGYSYTYSSDPTFKDSNIYQHYADTAYYVKKAKLANGDKDSEYDTEAEDKEKPPTRMCLVCRFYVLSQLN